MSRTLIVVALTTLALCALIAATSGRLLKLEPGLGLEDDLDAGELTALQEYVATPDANYNWTHLEQFDEQGLGYKIQWLNVTSQRWMTDADTDRSIWWHFVALIIPDNLNPSNVNNGVLWITGSCNDATTPPKITGEDLLVSAILAQTTQTVVTAVFNIPNCPVQFMSEHPPKSRNEDAIIAYGWAQYIQNPNQPQYLLRLPMTKGAIRAMDAATEFWQQQSGNSMDSWIVAGASKRGWTAWTVGICDQPRTVAIVPMVLDELNFVKNIHHHWRAYGGWSFALVDYVNENITTQFDTPEFAQAMTIVDPIGNQNYIDLLAQIPKLIISTGGDEFLLPDNNDWYWDILQGEKHFHQFPNLEHTMVENIPLVLDTVRGFIEAVQADVARPEYYWTKQADGTIHLEINANNPPSSVTVWSALTIDGNERRDFRLVAIMNNTNPPGKPFLHPVFWNQTNINPTSSNSSLIVYDSILPAPEVGWIGWNLQVIFPGVNGSNFRISTATSILPQTFPYPDCYMETCQGPMV